MSLQLQTGVMKYRESTSDTWHPLIIRADASLDALVEAYDSSATYEVGEYCLYDNVLYRCTTEISAAETWVPAHWTETSIGKDLEMMGDRIDDLQDKTVKTSVATGGFLRFEDGAGYATIPRFRVILNPSQTGSGTPSASNIRPFVGYTGMSIYTSGKNLFDIRHVISSGSSNTEVDLTEYTVAVSGTNGWCAFGSNPVLLKKGITYTLSAHIACITEGTARPLISICRTDNHNIVASKALENGVNDADVSVHYTPSADIEVYVSGLINNATASSVTAESVFSKIQLEVGSEVTAYENVCTLKKTTYNWSGSIGTMYAADIIRAPEGIITVRPYYASYSGQTLVGPWVSDRDVYAPGTTPTTGAQVVDLGGVFYVTSGSRTIFTTSPGVNYIFSDCDADFEVEYYSEKLDYVLRTGDTVTGDLIIRSSTYESNVTPSSEQMGYRLAFNDRNNTRVGYVSMDYLANGKQGIGIRSNRIVNGETIGNYLFLFIDGDGNRSIAVSEAKAWRDALSVVSKGGDTMTGDLTIQKADCAQLILKTTNGGSTSAIKAYADSSNSVYGNNIVFAANGNMIIGGGESAQSLYNAGYDECTTNKENLYLTADGYVNLYTNGDTIANRKTWTFNADGTADFPGDIRTPGRLQKSNTTMDTKAASLTAQANCYFAAVADKNPATAGTVYTRQTTNGNIATLLQACHYNTAATPVAIWNSLGPSVNADGTYGYVISSPRAFRKELGLGTSTGEFPISVAQGGTGNTSVDTTPTAGSTKMCTSGGIKTALDAKLNTSGGTMTGNITTSGCSLIVKSTAITSGTKVSTASWGNRVYLRDSANADIGYFMPVFETDGRQGVSICARRAVSGSTQDHKVVLYQAEDGTDSVLLSKDAWLKALSLYTTTLTSTNTATSIITAATGYTISANSRAVQWGKMIQLYIEFTNDNAITVPVNGNFNNITIGTTLAAFKPKITTIGYGSHDGSGFVTCLISTGGTIQLTGADARNVAYTIAAGTTFKLHVTYMAV